MGRINGRMSGKLRKLKGALKRWNESFGTEMEKRIEAIEERIKELGDISDQRDLIELEVEEFRRLY